MNKIERWREKRESGRGRGREGEGKGGGREGERERGRESFKVIYPANCLAMCCHGVETRYLYLPIISE